MYKTSQHIIAIAVIVITMFASIGTSINIHECFTKQTRHVLPILTPSCGEPVENEKHVSCCDIVKKHQQQQAKATQTANEQQNEDDDAPCCNTSSKYIVSIQQLISSSVQDFTFNSAKIAYLPLLLFINGAQLETVQHAVQHKAYYSKLGLYQLYYKKGLFINTFLQTFTC